MRALAVLLVALMLCLGAIIYLISQANAHSFYDAACCHNRDCYPLPDGYSYYELPDGNYHAAWISPHTGKIVEGIVSRNNVKDTHDGKEHGCETPESKPRCLYIHRGV